MPDPRDFLPQLPWIGPPIPKSVSKSLAEGFGSLYRGKLVTKVTESSMVAYHITSLEGWEEIKVQGLVPKSLGKRVRGLVKLSKGVYLFTDPDESMMLWGSIGGPILDANPKLKSVKMPVLEVNVPTGTTLVEDPEVSSEDEEDIVSWITPNLIPPGNVKLYGMDELSREEWGE